MAYSLENTADLTNLADAIRAKTGSNATMTVAQMATAIASISGGGGSSSGGGWTPTTFTNITSEMEFSKYSAELDLTNYLGNSPFILCVVYIKSDMSSSSYGWCVYYYSGSNMNRIVGVDESNLLGNNPDNNQFSCDYYNGIISFSNINTPWDTQTMAFLIT